MSSSTIMDSFDAPMLDYSGDMDVHMHTTEDVHHIHLPNPFPSHLPQQDVEIDMDDYYNENVEYEMADGELAVADTELVDIDVYDATRDEATSASASIPHSTGLTDQDIPKKSAEDHYLPSESEVATDHIPAISNLQPPPQPAVVQGHDTEPSDQSGAAVALQESTPLLEAVTKDSHSDGEASTSLEGHASSPRIATADSTSNNVTFPRGPEFSPAEHESSSSSHQAEIQDGDSHEGVRVHEESYEGGVPGPALDTVETSEPERPATESHEIGEEGNADPYEISEGVYIEPPPPVLIELPSQSICTLFNAPANLHSAETEVNVLNAEALDPVLLQTRPTLYYETLNDVFDALREEERIKFVPEFVDGEMLLDAYELQLVISEDNVHAREISLHDLNILHHGLDLIGPLRLRLRTVLPRFINRYRGLQGQITRLNVATASHPVEDPEEQTFVGSPHESDSGYYHVNDDGQTKQEPTGDDGQEELTGGVDDHEDVESTYSDHAEYQGEHEEADYDGSEQYADAQEYPGAHEDEAVAREESDQFVTNDESEPLPDPDPTYKGSADFKPTEDQEHEGDEGDEASGDAEVTSVITVTTHANETGFPEDELRVLTEVRDSEVTGESHFEEFEEDGEAEVDVNSEESAQSTSPGDNLGVVTNEEEKGAASSENTSESGAQEAESATTAAAISSRVEVLEPAEPSHHTEEDEENAESWELDDSYAVWEVTAGDEFDIGLVGEPDSVSTGSSTLSGETPSIASKRSIDAVDESDPVVEQSSLQTSIVVFLSIIRHGCRVVKIRRDSLQ
ncbi:hypothetical protein BJV77DRAFT_983220 [Russula vinacea]|nr:hypothetical protein BJV77DRAFT_983220 [Russula vinacea]